MGCLSCKRHAARSGGAKEAADGRLSLGEAKALGPQWIINIPPHRVPKDISGSAQIYTTDSPALRHYGRREAAPRTRADPSDV